MAVPKGKTSKARRNKRRANWKLAVPGMTRCKKCGAWIRPHYVCSDCGYYNGKQVVTVAAKAEEE